MPDPNQGGLFERLGNLVELITTLDVRVTNALEGLEEMRTSVTGLDPVRDDAQLMMADLKQRLDTWDARLSDDLSELKALAIEKLNGLDDVKALAMQKLGDLNASDLGDRFERMEHALMNVERATLNLNNMLEGGVDALPSFVARRVKRDARRQTAEHASEPMTPDELGH